MGRRRVQDSFNLEQRRTNRSRNEILIDILGLCEQPRKKTELMHMAKLSWPMFGDYVGALHNVGYLTTKKDAYGHDLYCITPQGQECLEKGREFLKDISPKGQGRHSDGAAAEKVV